MLYNLKVHQKRSALPFHGLNLYISPMKHHDLFAKAQPNAAAILFRTEERNENLIYNFVRHTNAIIGYFNNRSSIRGLIGR